MFTKDKVETIKLGASILIFTSVGYVIGEVVKNNVPAPTTLSRLLRFSGRTFMSLAISDHIEQKAYRYIHDFTEKDD